MTDELIERLVRDLEPVKALSNPMQRSVRFTLLAVFATTVTANLLGLRADLAAKLFDPNYVVETAVLLVLFGAATLATLRSGVPKAKPGIRRNLCRNPMVGHIVNRRQF